ncbi:PLP-dependent aminotransferase family protein [Aureibacillus halotolerans]|uniref:GntR family transcriptional regulator n=1 Tax=Aureibacillus halotolerans TaxID=1508390 RepID=A0A4V3D494_9BACI|nr:PLP-dependent aminotransferase family protein [Aureibacillus halotolerans]TDQ33451.1 GntR family transcriptional regulator [Aureibacillus halotolerans]
MFGILIDPKLAQSVTAQLCGQLRDKIENGELTEGTRLPPTRKLAQTYGIARNVVIDTYEQLTAEGYVIGKMGSGTFVAGGISPRHFQADPLEPEAMSVDSNHSEEIIDFISGVPDLSSFPRKMWSRYLREAAEWGADSIYNYGDVRGEYELRTAIASHLFRTRGMRCHPERIMIVTGSADGLAIAAKVLSTRYHSIYLEDPTIEFAQHIFRQEHFTLVPMEVDHSGMKLQNLSDLEEGHLLLLTPSHHYPSGSILTIQRRQLAVTLAEEADTYILEDDYDGDFRHKGIPVPPMYTLAPERVIYLGTFSKTLAPGLRIGFMVVPGSLVNQFIDLRENSNFRSPGITQIALARFMMDGRLDRHIHKMKNLYKHRRDVLIEALQQSFGDAATVFGDEAGMHIMVEFDNVRHDIDWQRSESYGVRFQRAKDCALNKRYHGNRVVLSYGHLNDTDIREGVKRLRHFITPR